MGVAHVGPLALLDPSCLTSFRVRGFFWAFYSLCFQCEAVFQCLLVWGSLGEKKELRSMP